MKRLLMRLSLILAASVFLAVGCSEDEVKNYTVPSSVVLERSTLNVADLSISLSAIYNGDDRGIKTARFVLWKDDAGASPSYYDCDWENGRAATVIAGLEKGRAYLYNFEIVTKGENLITCDERGSFFISEPADFSMATTTTATAKLFIVNYSGADEYVNEVKMSIIDSEGSTLDSAPEVTFGNGQTKSIFFLDEWEEDLYTITLTFNLVDGRQIVTPPFKLSLLPLPENVSLEPVAIDGETLRFSASYDGEDKTIAKATFSLSDKEGLLIKTVEGKFANRKVEAEISGQEYGRYQISCTLDLVDGSSLSAGPVLFVYARPRAFDNLLLAPIPMSEAGLVKSSADCNDPGQFTYSGYSWESQYLYARTSSGKTTLYVSSKYHGYFQCLTPFEFGIKTVYINHSSGKDTSKFKCFGKKGAKDDWIQLAEATKEGNTFIYDLSVDNYCYFRFETTNQELKANSFSVDYYTEAPDEY